MTGCDYQKKSFTVATGLAHLAGHQHTVIMKHRDTSKTERLTVFLENMKDVRHHCLEQYNSVVIEEIKP